MLGLEFSLDGLESGSDLVKKNDILSISFKSRTKEFFFCSLPNEYFDSIKGLLSDSYSVIGQV